MTGRRFAKKNGKDPDLYEAEALFQLVEIANTGKDQTVHSLRVEIVRGLYKYMYADHTVAVSKNTIWRNRQSNQEHKTALFSLNAMDAMGSKNSLQSDLGFNWNLIEKDRPIEFMELIDDICRTAEQKEYVRLVMLGHSMEEICKIMQTCNRLVRDIRTQIVQKLKVKL